jgi:GcrA cell cycle regulator
METGEGGSIMLSKLKWHHADRKGRIALIRSVYEPGLSAADIASRIGGVTRNAVIGMYTRWPDELADTPLEGRRRRKEPKKPARPKRQYKPSRILAFDPTERAEVQLLAPVKCEPVVDLPEPTPKMTSLMDLTSATCKWPVGDPKEAGFGFCGHAPDHGPYCPYHAQLAYRGAGRANETDPILAA